MNRVCAPSPRRGIAPKFPTLSVDRRWTCPGDSVNLIPFLPYFPVFDTLNAIRALRTGCWKYTLFTRFYFTRMMYRPQWDIPLRDIFIEIAPENSSFKYTDQRYQLTCIILSFYLRIDYRKLTFHILCHRGISSWSHEVRYGIVIA